MVYKICIKPQTFRSIAQCRMCYRFLWSSTCYFLILQSKSIKLMGMRLCVLDKAEFNPSASWSREVITTAITIQQYNCLQKINSFQKKPPNLNHELIPESICGVSSHTCNNYTSNQPASYHLLRVLRDISYTNSHTMCLLML